jgi:hypothetical protein
LTAQQAPAPAENCTSLTLDGTAVGSAPPSRSGHFCADRAESFVTLQKQFEHGLLVLSGQGAINGQTIDGNDFAYLGQSKACIAQAQKDRESSSTRFLNVKGGEYRRLQAPALPSGYAA